MPTFICFLNWTDQAAKQPTESSKRAQAARHLAETVGGKLLSAYVTTGRYDAVATVEMPDGDAMIKFVTALNSSGNHRTTTVRAFTPDEFSKIASQAPKP
jgi:uncharacterized protein with GYD domain